MEYFVLFMTLSGITYYLCFFPERCNNTTYVTNFFLD